MRLYIVLTLFCGLSCSAAEVEDEPIDDTLVEGWRLVWSDEFDGSGLPNTAKWTYDVGGHGWGNNELQYYANARPQNSRVENGHLVIEAHKEQIEGNAYSSARLVTKGRGDWTYGRFDIRAKLPSGRGTWPAIWMLASQDSYGSSYWPDNGEIDVMEHVGFEADVIHASVHTSAYNHKMGTQKSGTRRVSTSRSDFNVYRLDWSEGFIQAYINDELYFTFANERLTNQNADYRHWPFDRPFHVLLNLAVGGDWGGAQGVDENIWPQRMEVDYVRVYAKE